MRRARKPKRERKADDDLPSAPHSGRPQIVFDAVTTAEGIAPMVGSRPGRCCGGVGPARRRSLSRAFLRMLDNTEYESSGEFLEIVRPERVVMSWRWKDGVPDPGESRVEIMLKTIPKAPSSRSCTPNCRTRNPAAAMKGLDGRARQAGSALRRGRRSMTFSYIEMDVRRKKDRQRGIRRSAKQGEMRHERKPNVAPEGN